MRKSILGIVWENTTPSTELLRDFCAGIGPLQLGVVLFFSFLIFFIGPIIDDKLN